MQPAALIRAAREKAAAAAAAAAMAAPFPAAAAAAAAAQQDIAAAIPVSPGEQVLQAAAEVDKAAAADALWAPIAAERSRSSS